MKFRLVVQNQFECDRDALKRLLRSVLEVIERGEASSGVIRDLKGHPIGEFEYNNET